MTDAELDRALARIIAPPELSAQFRVRLASALAQARVTDIAAARSRIENEQREQLAAIDQNFVRLRRRTLGNMIGGAFAAGAAAAVALPWLSASVGAVAPLLIASVGAAVGISLGLATWLRMRAPAGR